MLKSRILFSILLLISVAVHGQERKLFFSGGGGMIYYLGDLTEKKLPQKETMYPYAHLSAGYRFSNTFSLTLGYLRGKVGGADSLTAKKEVRDYHFESTISDIHLLVGIDVKNIWRIFIRDKGVEKRLDHVELVDGPKILLGMGYFKFNPRANYMGNWWNLQTLGTEGQKIEGDYPDPYRLWQLNVKLGGEIGFRLNKKIQLDIYGLYHILFTDHLDDVGGEFPDYEELLDTPNGELTSNFTYRRKDGKIPAKGAPRGNKEINDSYVNFGIKLTYSLSKTQINQFRNR